MTYSITRFALYDVMKDSWKRLNNRDPKLSLKVWELGVCAGLSGGIAGLVGNPAEVRTLRDNVGTKVLIEHD